MNGKETPKESFKKFTGNMFLKKLKGDLKMLQEYAVEQKTELPILAKRPISDINYNYR